MFKGNSLVRLCALTGLGFGVKGVEGRLLCFEFNLSWFTMLFCSPLTFVYLAVSFLLWFCFGVSDDSEMGLSQGLEFWCRKLQSLLLERFPG